MRSVKLLADCYPEGRGACGVHGDANLIFAGHEVHVIAVMRCPRTLPRRMHTRHWEILPVRPLALLKRDGHVGILDRLTVFLYEHNKVVVGMFRAIDQNWHGTAIVDHRRMRPLKRFGRQQFEIDCVSA